MIDETLGMSAPGLPREQKRLEKSDSGLRGEMRQKLTQPMKTLTFLEPLLSSWKVAIKPDPLFQRKVWQRIHEPGAKLKFPRQRV
jgi:hypothetical protein